MKRKATAHWQGSGMEGMGKISTMSGVLQEQPYSFRTRFTNEEGRLGTNPEELMAAAHAGCFTMALAFALGQKGFLPERLSTEAVLTMEQIDGQFSLLGVELRLEAHVPGIEPGEFESIAKDAKNNCPVSRALAALDITLVTLLMQY